MSGEPRASYAPSPSTPPRVPYTPPAVDRVQDRLDPLGYRAEPRAPAYGSAQPTYNTQNTHDDFFADEPLRGAQQNGSYKTYSDDFDTRYDDDYQARTYNDDYDDHDTAIYPGADDASEDDLPVRRRRGSVKVLASALSLALIGGLGAWGYSSLGGEETSNGTPPVIKAPTTSAKVVAQAKPIEKTKESYDRIPVNSDAKVGPAPEEPGERPSPRVVLPGAPEQQPVENRIAEAPSSPPPQMPAAPTIPQRESTGTVERPQNTGPRVVQTLTIRPDGTPVPFATAQAEPPAAPQPIEGSGPAAGMSLQPGPEFGIMQSAAPQASEPPSQQTAYAPVDVPMPLPRPPDVRDAPPPPASPTPQARAATPAPVPATSGPPSSPQPQVTVTNKRALHPQGPIPAPRNTSSQRPAAAEPQHPAARQVAMVGSAAPIAASSAPAPAVAQVATVASSSGGSFGVQLTAQRSEEEAVAAFNTLKQRHPQNLGPYTATVARADLGPDRGVFYRAMVPAQSQQDAANLCIQFKSQGVDCIVQRR
jgi:hypothetical protein